MSKIPINEVPIGSLCKLTNTVIELLDTKSDRIQYLLVTQLESENRYHVIPLFVESGNKIRCMALGFVADADGTCLIASHEDVVVVQEAKASFKHS